MLSQAMAIYVLAQWMTLCYLTIEYLHEIIKKIANEYLTAMYRKRILSVVF